MKDGGRVLIMHQGALGDFLLMLPVIEAFHSAYPHVRIDFWSKADHIALIAHRDYFGEAYSSNGLELTPFYHEELWREATLPAPFSESDEIFIFGQEIAKVVADRIAMKTVRRIHWVQSYPAPDEDVPVSRFILKQFRAMGFSLEETSVQMRPLPEEKSWVRAWLAGKGWERKGPVLMHPGSGGIGKIWPLKYWWDLVSWLKENSDRPMLMTLGPADDILKDFASEVERKGTTVLKGLSLVRLAALMAESCCYVGGDSGVSHLASMMGVPSLIIFGPTEPAIWGPRGANVSIFQDRWQKAEVLAWSHADIPGTVDPRIRKTLEKHVCE